jgi:hypothetical protein
MSQLSFFVFITGEAKGPDQVARFVFKVLQVGFSNCRT